MNDRFKFRAKRLDNNKFVYGYLCFIYTDNEKHCRIYSPDDAMSYDCYTETLGQYTGLKDKNGKLIYEGDIVELDDGTEINNAVIEWEEQSGQWVICTTDTIYTFDNLYGNDLTVIGNIHENADLLENEE